MNLYTKDGALLYESSNETLQTTLENAIEEGVILDQINLKNKDLRNINFDTVIMRHACLVNADLTGANMSEAIFDHTDFSQTQLYNTCIAYSSLKACTFINSQFGATDFSESQIDGSTFAGSSLFSIVFRAVKSMQNVHFLYEKIAYSMQNVPIHITNSAHDINVLDDHILIEHDMFSYEELELSQHASENKSDLVVFYNDLIKLSKNRSFIEY